MNCSVDSGSWKYFIIYKYFHAKDIIVVKVYRWMVQLVTEMYSLQFILFHISCWLCHMVKPKGILQTIFVSVIQNNCFPIFAIHNIGSVLHLLTFLSCNCFVWMFENSNIKCIFTAEMSRINFRNVDQMPTKCKKWDVTWEWDKILQRQNSMIEMWFDVANIKGFSHSNSEVPLMHAISCSNFGSFTRT